MTGSPGLAPSRGSRQPLAARRGCQARSDRLFGEGKSKRRDHKDEQKASKARIGWFCLGRRTKLLSGKFQGGKSNSEPRSSTPRAAGGGLVSGCFKRISAGCPLSSGCPMPCPSPRVPTAEGSEQSPLPRAKSPEPTQPHAAHSHAPQRPSPPLPPATRHLLDTLREPPKPPQSKHQPKEALGWAGV